jgi:hypothetical protein
MSETWDKQWCPECKEDNWICLGNLDDLTQPDIEAVKCWNCPHMWWTTEESEEINRYDYNEDDMPPEIERLRDCAEAGKPAPRGCVKEQ